MNGSLVDHAPDSGADASELRRRQAAEVIRAACVAAGASPSTCLIVPGLFLRQLEEDDQKEVE